MDEDQGPKMRSRKTTSRLIRTTPIVFFITIFRLAIQAFFRFTDVTEEGWYGQPKYCYEKTIDVVLISYPVVFGLLVFGSILVAHLFYSYDSN